MFGGYTDNFAAKHRDQEEGKENHFMNCSEPLMGCGISDYRNRRQRATRTNSSGRFLEGRVI